MSATPGGGATGRDGLRASGSAARRDAEQLIEPAAELAASELDRRRVRSLLPHVLVDVPVAVVLVDTRAGEVVYANNRAAELAGDVRLPAPLGEWGRSSSLTDLAGHDLSGADSPLVRVMAAAPSGGEAVRAGTDGGLGRLLWATGIPLSGTAAGTGDGDGHGDAPPLALLLLLEVAAPPGAEDDPDALLAALRDRAVIATDLAFTISDPSAPDNPLVWVNPAFTRMTGYAAADVIGLNCRFLQGPDTDPAAVDDLRRAIAAREAATVVLLNYRRDGTPFWNQLSISPVLDGDGTLLSYVGVQHDVSERVRIDHEREQALLAERRARLEVEQARQRLALLAEVTTRLSATLDTQESIERLASVVVPRMADWVVVAVAGPAPDGAAHMVVRHRDGHHDVVARYQALAPQAYERNPLIDDLMAGGGARLLEGFDRAALAERAGPDMAEVVEALGYESALYVPLVARQRRVLGTMIMVASSPERRFGVEDLAVAEDLGRRAGISLDNARLYEQEHRFAEVLQRSLLPAMPEVEGAAAAASYLPANAAADVGGDFYELLDLPDGALGMAVGDVVGHDMTAAAAMGHLRGLLRACAWDTAAEPGATDPARVLDRVDRLVQGLDVVPLATLVYLRAARCDAGWSLTWANAGHPPPLLRLADGTIELLDDGAGVLLGVDVAPDRPTATRRVPSGTTVLGYTDGLIERRGEPLEAGISRVAATLAGADPADLPGLVRSVVGGLGEERDDDVAVIAVRLD